MMKFKKMHGLGNDFVIVDCRENGVKLTKEQSTLISNRKHGVGCDQLILLERSKSWAEMTFMRILNPDGSEAEACGNATRCVADVLMNEDSVDNIVIETLNGSLNCWKEGEQVRVEMGKPKMDWQKIPLSHETDTLNLPFKGSPVAVNMGNPHCVFFVNEIDKEWNDAKVEEWGREFEINPLFPQKTNVEFVQVIDKSTLRMRVWERGAGITQACGSGACAVAVAAIKRGLSNRKVTVKLDGGDLIIDWPNDDAQVSMTGPVTYVFDGTLEDF